MNSKIKKIAAVARNNFLAYANSINSWHGWTVCPEFTNLRDTPCGIIGVLRAIAVIPEITPTEMREIAPRKISGNTLQAIRWAGLAISENGRYTMTRLGHRLLLAYNA